MDKRRSNRYMKIGIVFAFIIFIGNISAPAYLVNIQYFFLFGLTGRLLDKFLFKNRLDPNDLQRKDFTNQKLIGELAFIILLYSINFYQTVEFQREYLKQAREGNLRAIEKLKKKAEGQK